MHSERWTSKLPTRNVMERAGDLIYNNLHYLVVFEIYFIFSIILLISLKTTFPYCTRTRVCATAVARTCRQVGTNTVGSQSVSTLYSRQGSLPHPNQCR